MPGSDGMGEGGSGDSMFYKWAINAGSTAISFLACDSESIIDTANFAQFGSGQLDWMQVRSGRRTRVGARGLTKRVIVLPRMRTQWAS